MDLRGHEELGDVLQAAGNFIDEIFGIAGAVDAAGDADLAQHGVRLGQRAAVVGLEQQRNLGHPGGRIGVVAGVDEVFGAFAAQASGRLLAEHPADGVDDVGLAAPVGADDRRDSGRETDAGRLEKGLEAY